MSFIRCDHVFVNRLPGHFETLSLLRLSIGVITRGTKLNSDAHCARVRIPLICAASSVGLDGHARCVRVAVSLSAALLSTRAAESMALLLTAHCPPSGGALPCTSASTEVVAILDAVDEAHVVPDIGRVDAILELHGRSLAFLVDFEDAVAAVASLQGVVPGGAGLDVGIRSQVRQTPQW
jgi:hypothetical protein